MTQLIDIPPELIVRICDLLDPNSILSLGLTNTFFRNCTQEETIWKSKCKPLFKDKFNVKLQIHPRIQIHPGLLETFTAKEIKTLLQERGASYAMKGLYEKSEFIKLLLETALPKYGPGHQPQWSSKWKATYFVAIKDGKRCKITKSELVDTKWSFEFLQQDMIDDQIENNFDAKFNDDYTYESSMFRGNLSWRFYQDAVQVAQYPPLKVLRDDKWNFYLRNNYVIFKSIDTK